MREAAQDLIDWRSPPEPPKERRNAGEVRAISQSTKAPPHLRPLASVVAAPHNVERLKRSGLQQSLGDPSNFGRVFAQLFVGAVAALVSQCLALRHVFGCSVIPKHLPHVAKVERCLGGTSWRRERIFR